MDSPAITLDAMSEDEFAEFIVWVVRDQVVQQTRTGRWAAEDALNYAKGEVMLVLPQGLQTPDTYIYAVRDALTGERVGSLWLMLRRRARMTETYVYNLVVEEPKRGLGYGRAMMRATADWAREHGTATVGLHVFGHNAPARALYRSLGLRETNVTMQWDLDAPADAPAQ